MDIAEAGADRRLVGPSLPGEDHVLGRRGMLRSVAALVSGALVTIGLVVSAAPATADANAPLSAASFTAMVVDPVHRRVFVSSFSGIEVRGFDTSAIGFVALPTGTPPRVSAMVLSADSSTLYAVLVDAKGVARISTTTLAVDAVYSMTSSCPRTIARAGDTVYLGFGCTSVQRVAPLMMSGTTATLGTPLEGEIASTSDIEADPTGRWLVATTEFPQLKRWDLSATPPTVITSTNGLLATCHPAKVSVGDGEFISTCADPGLALGMSPVDLTPTTRYPVGYFTTRGAAVSSTVVAVAGYNTVPDVLVYPRGSTTPTRRLDFPEGNYLALDGLASTPNGDHVFAVSTDIFNFRLYALVEPLTAQTDLALTAPATATRGTTLSMNGTLTADWPLGTGVALTATRTDLAGTHALPDVTTNATGAFTLTDSPTVGGPVTWTVSYPGTADRQPASVSRTVTVPRLTPSITVTTDKSLYSYKATATVRVHLGRTFNGRTVNVYSRLVNTSRRVLIGTGTVDASGDLRVHPTVVRRVTFIAEFPGDYRYAPATVSTTVRVRAKVGETLKRWYSTSNGDYLYRTTTNPLLVAHFSPSLTGGCVFFLVQRYSGGTWRDWASTPDCVVIDANSDAAGELVGSHPTGYRFRIRARFVGSFENAPNTGAWKYFRFR